MISIKIYLSSVDGSEEDGLAVEAQDSGCVVGVYLKVLKFRWPRLECQVATVTEIHSVSSNSSKRARSHRFRDMATCIMSEGYTWPVFTREMVTFAELSDLDETPSRPPVSRTRKKPRLCSRCKKPGHTKAKCVETDEVQSQPHSKC
jgi:hypothetical protein